MNEEFIVDDYYESIGYTLPDGSYLQGHFQAKLFSEISSEKVYTTSDGTGIFLETTEKKYFYSKTKEGLSVKYSIIPSLYQITDTPYGTKTFDTNPSTQKFNLDGVDKLSFYYNTGGACSIDIQIVDLNETDLKQIGSDYNNNPIYVFKSEDPYAKKLYDEDYIGAEWYKYNPIPEDNETPLDYNTYLSRVPIFYWKDYFGRFMRFTNGGLAMLGGCGKPVVYLYPEKTEPISVTVNIDGFFTLTIPEFRKNQTWDVIANPNGQIINIADKKSYDYLWWEGGLHHEINIPKEGFVIANKDLEVEISRILKVYGLSENETRDFVEFWVETMRIQNKPFYKVSFLFGEEVNQVDTLEFSKKPDSELRVFMFFEPLDKKIEIDPQFIPTEKREGFTIVEWGGSLR